MSSDQSWAWLQCATSHHRYQCIMRRLRPGVQSRNVTSAADRIRRPSLRVLCQPSGNLTANQCTVSGSVHPQLRVCVCPCVQKRDVEGKGGGGGTDRWRMGSGADTVQSLAARLSRGWQGTIRSTSGCNRGQNWWEIMLAFQ